MGRKTILPKDKNTYPRPAARHIRAAVKHNPVPLCLNTDKHPQRQLGGDVLEYIATITVPISHGRHNQFIGHGRDTPIAGGIILPE
jgi:hypothetical protein